MKTTFLTLLTIFIIFLGNCLANEESEKGKRMESSQIDVNKPVENPKLKKAISDYYQLQNSQTESQLVKELNQAIYIVAIITDEMKTSEVDKDGKTTIQKGSLIKFLLVYDSENNPLLPLFTDWDEIRKWTKEDVGGMVMPASDAWDFVEKDGQYKGVVINPGGKSWQMNIEQIQAVKKENNT